MATEQQAGAPAQRGLSERQTGRWALQRATSDSDRVQPCVAISRLPGAGGAEVGQRVAEWLDYGFFGRLVVNELAKDLGSDHWVVAGLDERERARIESHVAEALGPDGEAGHPLRAVVQTVATLGRRGSAVIVGRGAAFLLEPDDALRVLVLAPREQRLRRFARLRSLSGDAAKAALAEEEARRTEFARARFGERYDDPTLYDLVINTGHLDLEAAAGVVIAALRRRFPT